MKVTDPRSVDPAIEAQVSAMFRAGCERNDVVTRMRALGLHKIDCIKLFRSYGGVTLSQAKDIVHLSPAWADRYAFDEAFQNTAEQALNMMLEEDKYTAA